jgi:transcriptional regulator with XRE-family HTH domain
MHVFLLAGLQIVVAGKQGLGFPAILQNRPKMLARHTQRFSSGANPLDPPGAAFRFCDGPAQCHGFNITQFLCIVNSIVLKPFCGYSCHMSPVSSKMNQREREIGARLKEFREGIDFSQASFAGLIGITRDQLASIEYGRTPIRYGIAWKIRRIFGLSVDWLWGGDTLPDDLSEDAKLPHPDSPKIDKNALLTEVFEFVFNLSDVEFFSRSKTKKVQLDKKEISHRAFITMALHSQIEEWVAQVPDGYTVDFSNKFFQLAKTYLEALPKEPEELVDARFDALIWDKMRGEIVSKTVWVENGSGKKDLTDVPINGNNSDVKAKLPTLLKRLNEATHKRGMKTSLAKFMGVPLSKVSEWLAGVHEPSGETTLQLLQWVEQQEHQK